MPSKIAVQTIQKIAQIWSSKRECQIAVRIQYQVRVEAGCKIYQLSQTEELA
jgi:hypothetical protein